MLETFVALTLSAATFQPTLLQELRGGPTNDLTLELGTLSAPLTGDLPTAVRDWSLSQRTHFGLPAQSTLTNGPAFTTRFGASFRLQQQVDGIDVYSGQLVVTLDAQARVHQVSSSLIHTPRVDAQFSIDETEALKRAAATLELPALQANGVPFGGARKYFFEVDGALHAGYLTYVPTLDRRANWYVAIDAVTGSILFRQNRVHHASLDANVYPISPGGLDGGVGVTPTQIGTLTHPDGGSLIIENDGGFLIGDQITQYNCCASKDCNPDAGFARSAGTTQVMGFNVQYDVAVCQRTRRANNAVGGRTDYRYDPIDPPSNAMTVVGTDLANSDEFAEVHSFYHVNRVYDWVRGLSAAGAPIFTSPGVQPFMMRDERRTPAQRPAIWANFMLPNFQEIFANPGCFLTPPCRANSLSRVDNAAFTPKEQLGQFMLPDFDLGVDTLLIFQGNVADAAYDSTVIQHEFGHGVVYSTAALTFDNLASDNRSANNEGGALHEGFADYIAAAFNNEPEIGQYFGPRVAAGMPILGNQPYLRTMTNTYKCPDVLWGEVHQDSMHVAGALWDGRLAFGTPAGLYDAAFYAMLVALAPTADFAQVATTMADRVAMAFPSQTDARTRMQGFFSARGVTNCSKILEVIGGSVTRDYYGIAAGTQALGNSMIPGPFQFKLLVPTGSQKLTIKGATGGGGGGPFGGGMPKANVLVKVGAPITFARTTSTLTNDATTNQTITFAQDGTFTQTVDLAVPCDANAAVYVSIAAPAGGTNIQNLSVASTPLTNCMLPVPDGGVDAGAPDAGHDGGVDAGSTETTTVISVGPGSTIEQPQAAAGCGCQSSGSAAPLMLGALAYLLLRRRQN